MNFYKLCSLMEKMQNRAIKFFLVVILLLHASSVSSKAADEYFSDVEIDQIREAQEIERRIFVFLGIAEARLVHLGLMEAKKNEEGKIGKVAKALVSIFQPGLAVDIENADSTAKKQASQSDAQLAKFTPTELLHGFYQALEEAMDNIDDAYERKRGKIRDPLEKLKHFTEMHLPILKRFNAKTSIEESALNAAIEQAELALEGSASALKLIPKTPGNN